METTEQSRVLNHLASYPGFANTTMKTKDFNALLLETDGWMMARGRIWDIVGESLGAGVYRVTTKQRDTD